MTREDKLGASLGGLSSIMDIGQSIGPLITGIIITYFSFSIGFFFSLIIAILTAIIFLMCNWKR